MYSNRNRNLLTSFFITQFGPCLLTPTGLAVREKEYFNIIIWIKNMPLKLAQEKKSFSEVQFQMKFASLA